MVKTLLSAYTMRGLMVKTLHELKLQTTYGENITVSLHYEMTDGENITVSLHYETTDDENITMSITMMFCNSARLR